MKLPGIILLLCLLAGTASASYDYTVYQPQNEDGAYYTCADGHVMTLKNNPDAVNPTYEQAMTLIREDKTDEIEYDINKFHCVDSTETFHNNAEKAGFRCGVADIVYQKLYNMYTHEYNIYGHECNVFELNDGSLLYVDCVQEDSIAHVNIGEVYTVIDIDDGETHTQYEITDVHRYW